MSESHFPWPWRAENRKISLFVLGWILLLNLWALVAIDFLPISRKSQWDPAANLRAPLFARFDSGWYDTIVRYGYQAPPEIGQQSAHSFFPLYPMLGRYLHLATGVDSFQTALLVTYAALFLAIPLLVEEAKARFGEARARDALPFLFLYPVGFFLAAVYTESLFLLVALLAFRSVRRGELWLAVLFGVLLGLTRAPAAAVGPALALSWWFTRKDDPRRLSGAGLLLFAPLVGVLGWIFGIGYGKGEPMLFFRSMGAWRHAAGNPVEGVFAFFREPIDAWRSGHFREHPLDLGPVVHFVLFSFLGAVQLKLRRWQDAAWTFCVLALPVLTGTWAGIPRYTLTVYPGHFAAAALCQDRPFLRRLWLGVSVVGLLLNAAFFTNWHFVS